LQEGRADPLTHAVPLPNWRGTRSQEVPSRHQDGRHGWQRSGAL